MPDNRVDVTEYMIERLNANEPYLTLSRVILEWEEMGWWQTSAGKVLRTPEAK